MNAVKESKKKLVKGSGTVGYICFTRACAYRDPCYHGSDNMAEIFLPIFARVILNVPFLKKMFLNKISGNGIYGYVIARTRVMDEFFVRALREGYQQIVILGAGMDTRAWRFANQNRGARVFELDLESVQREKLKILKRKGVALPEGLVLAGIDFNKEDLGQVLAAAGYRRGLRTLFMMEGLVMYLDADSVERMLAFIHESVLPGSLLVFDYVQAAVLRKEGRFYGEKGLADTVAGAGETWTFGIDETAIANYLVDRGFHLIAHYTGADLEKKYFTAPYGVPQAHVNGTHCIAGAEVG
jgi:methyltransferase (TIGR00027 family)